MRHGSLFSGIGGFDLASEWMGWENVFHCDSNKFCQRILKYYWPDAELFDDITKSSFLKYRGRIDIITGGFPCQPYSIAGKRKGKADDRHLWPEMLRAIREVQPNWIVGENVPGLLNWEGGVVLAEIKADLESAGFEVFPPCILPACGKNAPHRRDRLWIIGYSTSNRRERQRQILADENGQSRSNEGWKLEGRSEGLCNNGTTSNTGHKRQEKSEQQAMGSEQLSESGIIANGNDKGSQRIKKAGNIEREGEEPNKQLTGLFRTTWEIFPTVSPIRGRDDGLSPKLVKQCLEALGNAVVPQVVFEIFKAIEKYE